MNNLLSRHRTLFLLCAVILAGFGSMWPVDAAPAPLSKAELARQELNAKFDKTNLRHKKEFTTDRSDAFLKIPPVQFGSGFTVAKTAPTVKFQILPNLEPEYFSEDAYQAGWANWAYVARSDDNRFYLATSNHLGRGAQIN